MIQEHDIFGRGTCENLAKEFNTQVLASIPMEPSIRVGGDEGKPIVYFYPDSVTSKQYQIAAKALWENISKSKEEGKIGNDDIQPNLPTGVSACSTEGKAYKAEQEAKKAAQEGDSCCGGGHCS